MLYLHRNLPHKVRVSGMKRILVVLRKNPLLLPVPSLHFDDFTLFVDTINRSFSGR